MLGLCLFCHLLLIPGLKSLTSSYGEGMEFVQFCCSLSFFFLFFIYFFFFEKLEESDLHIQPWLSSLSIS